MKNVICFTSESKLLVQRPTKLCFKSVERELLDCKNDESELFCCIEEFSSSLYRF